MPDLRPLRDYSTHDVINFFAVSGANVPKGTFVTVQGSGVNFGDALTLDNLSPYAGTLSAQFNVPWNVVPATSGTAPAQILGVLLKDRKTVDENGIPLIFFPKRAAELDCVVSGQAAPVLRRGTLLYSGIAGTPAFGSGVAISDDGLGGVKVVAPGASTAFGRFLGPKDSNGCAVIEFDLTR